MIVVVTAVNLLGGLTPFTEAILEPTYLLRLAVACPALLVILLVILLATYLPALRRHYQSIAGRDGLSGLYNRPMFDTLTRRLRQQAQRDGAALPTAVVSSDSEA